MSRRYRIYVSVWRSDEWPFDPLPDRSTIAEVRMVATEDPGLDVVVSHLLVNTESYDEAAAYAVEVFAKRLVERICDGKTATVNARPADTE